VHQLKKTRAFEQDLKTTIIYVGATFPGQVTDEAIFSYYNKGYYIFADDIKKYRAICSMLLNGGVTEESLKSQVLEFKTIDSELDNEIFSLSDDISSHFIDIILKYSTKNSGFAGAFNETKDALKSTLADRYAAQLRKELLLFRHIREVNAESIIIIPDTSKVATLYTDRLLNMPIDVYFDFSILPKLQQQSVESTFEGTLHHLIDSIHNNNKMNMYSFSGEYEAKRESKANIIISGNFKDKQYLSTIAPIACNIRDHESVHIIPSSSSTLSEVMTGIAKFNDTGNIKDKKTISVATREKEKKHLYVNSAIQEIATAAIQDVAKGWDSKFGKKISLYAIFKVAPILKSLLQYAENFFHSFSQQMSKTAAVVVCPGRYFETSAIVLMAHNRNIPTHEIQSGTISPTSRFKAPLADYIYCIDSFSHSVYSDFLKVNPKRITITGSPRIDYFLKSVREIKQNEAREQLYPKLDFHNKTNILVATQPIGVQKMSSFVSTIIKACENHPNYSITIKPHPNEKAASVLAYEKLIKNSTIKNITILESGSIYLAIQAADFVCTYFSTVGLEAFALGKKVITLNIWQELVPFNLHEIGVAAKATNTHELSKLLSDAERSIWPIDSTSNGNHAFCSGTSAKVITEAIIRSTQRNTLTTTKQNISL